ncbi:MAG: glycosyltransferase [Cytophagales bacterium]|nr:MAG: glycosyltransferase [Cytophagales bacterium]TAF60149.1 MAG: glycosyltransferase [Cytophagales bacterium]
MLPKILIASVLKPVDDNRLYHKIALSLAAEYEVHLVGYEGNTEKAAHLNVHLHPEFRFSRLSYKRLLCVFKLYEWVKKLQPDVLIVAAVELLPIVFFIKPFVKHIIYDIQEDYYKNIRYQNIYPKGLKVLLANTIRYLENTCSKKINCFLLSEKIYQKDLNFINKNSFLLENKVSEKYIGTPSYNFISFYDKINISCLVYGNISKSYFIEKSIQLIKNLNKNKSNISFSLKIVGNCLDNSYKDYLKNIIDLDKAIELAISKKTICYETILENLKNSDVILMPYQINESNQERIPTKFYECLAFSKPMIISKNIYWDNFLEPYQAHISIDFDTEDSEDLKEKILRTVFYPSFIAEDTYSSKEDLSRLLAYLNSLKY